MFICDSTSMYTLLITFPSYFIYTVYIGCKNKKLLSNWRVPNRLWQSLYSEEETRANPNKTKDDIRNDLILIEKSEHRLIANFAAQVRIVQDVIISHVMDCRNNARIYTNQNGVRFINLNDLRQGLSLSRTRKLEDMDTVPEEQRVHNNRKGIVNRGNDCYINSSVQFLFSDSELMEYLSSNKEGNPLITELCTLWTSLMGIAEHTDVAPAASLLRSIKK